MNSTDPKPLALPRWLHPWAVLTVVATLPLLLLGAEVTTKGVGMVDERGLRAPWYVFQGALAERGLGWMIEHGHRLAGWIVGLCVIVLAVGLWRQASRPWLRWLGVVALVAVCVQGTLGIFRIELNALMGKTLALVHGCFAQIVFTLLICLTLFTSRVWASRPAAVGSSNLRAWSVLTVILVFGQLLLGGIVRHQDHPLAARFHLLIAFAVVASALWLTKLALEHDIAPRAVKVLLGLIAVQVFLGVESWIARFTHTSATGTILEPLAVHADWFRSLHYLTGTLIFATSVVIALRAQQALAWSAMPAPAARAVQEGA
jgi:cytochrome c oxidase assembly protein subunit 15